MNCKDYQDDLRVRAENDQAAQKTKQMLDVSRLFVVFNVALILPYHSQREHLLSFLQRQHSWSLLLPHLLSHNTPTLHRSL